MKIIITYLCLLLTLSLYAQQKGASPVQSAVSSSQSAVTRAVIIGISDYRNERIPDLRFAHRDAEAFASYLKSPAGGSLPEENIMLLTNEKATTGQMVAAMGWIVEECKPGDKAILYFSGHSDVERISKFQRGYLLTYDSPPNNYMAGAFPVFGLQDIISTLSEMNVQVVMVSDACRAGKLAGSNINGAQATSAILAQQFANEIKILSCQPEEFSLEGEQWGGGRGCFSYHLLDGLYGLADDNGDKEINLLELGRYVEDKVMTEAAPHSQIPMTVGSKAAVLANVNKNYLDEILANKKRRQPILAGIESKGIEDLILENADTNIQQLYQDFLVAIKNGDLMEPEGQSANDYYEILIREKSIEKLHGFMRRNFAAALQDDSQKAINKYLETNKIELEKRNKLDSSYFRFPKYLNRAAELLGKGHYMYRNLKAKEHYYTGLLLRLRRDYLAYYSNSATGVYDTTLTNDAFSHQFKALEFDSQSAFINHEIALLFRSNGNREKALEHTAISSKIAPSWGLTVFYHANDLHVNGYNKESIPIYKKAIELAPEYCDAYSELGRVYMLISALDSAQYWMERAIQVDSNSFWTYGDLSQLNAELGDFDKSAYYSQKMVEKAGDNQQRQKLSLCNLAIALMRQKNTEEGSKIIKKLSEQYPDDIHIAYSIACAFSIAEKKEEAIEALEKSIERGYNYYEWIKMDTDLENIRSTPEFNTLMKKYFPEQQKK